MVQMTVRDHDQIDALWSDSGPAQVRLEPGKAAEGWADFLPEASIDKNKLLSRVDYQHVIGDLDHRLHEVCFQHRGKFAFRDVHGEHGSHWKLTIAIRDYGRLEFADLEAIEAIAVEGFRAGLTVVLRLGRGGAKRSRR